MTLVHLLFTLCFSTAVFCRTVGNGLGPDSPRIVPLVCLNGPEVWCQNFTTAAECGAMKHCVQTVWSKTNLQQSDSCSSCEAQIDNIRNGVNSNTTKKAIQMALDYICEMTIVTRILIKECEEVINKYVDENINELLDLLKSDIDSKTVCHILGFCSAAPTLTSTTPPAAVVDEVVLQFNNVILHFPVQNTHIIDILNKDDLEVTEKPALIGSKRCTWGPSYWCGNISNSKECHSTSHCIQSVWSKKVYNEDHDSVCKICKDMVQQARDQLLSNETQEELKEVFEGSCKLIPIKEVRKECIVLADEFVPELTEMLASQMNPTAVCTVAGLCNSPRIDTLLTTATASESIAVDDLSKVDSCVNCTVAFTSLHRFLSSTSKNEVLPLVLAICNQLSTYSGLCMSLVTTNFDHLYHTLTTQLQPFAGCHLTGMCTSRYHSHSLQDANFQRQVDTMLASHNDDLPCDLCKQLVLHLKQILVTNTTEDEFLAVLKGICQQTGTFKDECLQIVEADFKIFYQFLTEELDPVEVCTEINICPRARTLLTDERVNLIANRNPQVIPGLWAEVNVTSVSPTQVPAKVANAECKFCKMLVSQIEQELQNPDYEHDIEAVLKKICWLVPSSDQQECKDFINDYTDQLIKVLEEEANPNVVCAMLSICPGVYAAKRREASGLCPLCQDLLHYIQQSLDDSNSQQQIVQAVEQVCTIVPSKLKDQCVQFISQYSSLLISILALEVDPSIVCPAIKVCPSLQSQQQRCGHCRVLMTSLVNQLNGNHQIGNIENKLVNFVPSKGDSKVAVAAELKVSHAKDLVDMMVAEFDATESCVYMQFCNTSLIEQAQEKGGNVETNEISARDDVEDKPSCAICEMLVHMYEDKLTCNQTKELLEELLDAVCAKLTDDKLKDECTKSVALWVPVILDQLKKDVTPKKLCVAAKLCSLQLARDKVEAECSACELVVGGLESTLGDPTFKGEVVEKALQVCNYMSGKAHLTCVSIVEQLVPQLESIAFGIPPWFVCTKLKLCPYGDRLDMSVCSSASLWCRDVKTAFMCDRLSYCKKNAWKYEKPSRN